MTRDEYVEASEFMRGIGILCPPPGALLRGGIIGIVYVDSIVSRSDSPWFFGPRGLVLRDPQPCAFKPSVGALGYFEWKEADVSIVPAPAKWMLPKADVEHPASVQLTSAQVTSDLFNRSETGDE